MKWGTYPMLDINRIHTMPCTDDGKNLHPFTDDCECHPHHEIVHAKNPVNNVIIIKHQHRVNA